MTYETLIEKQHEIEQRSLEEGARRWEEKQDRNTQIGGEINAEDTYKFSMGVIGALTAEIDAWKRHYELQGGGRKPVAYNYLKELPSETLANHTMSHVFSAILGNSTTTNMLCDLGRLVQAELIGKRLDEENARLIREAEGEEATAEAKKEATRAAAAIANQSSLQAKIAAMRKMAAKRGVDEEPWDAPLAVLVASPLLNSVLVALEPFFEQVKRQDAYYLQFTPQGAEVFEKIRTQLAFMRPVFKAMAVPPLPWKGLYDGGYLNAKLRRVAPMMRTRHKKHRELIKAAIEDGSLSYAMKALDLMGSTPMKISGPVLDVVEWCWKEGKEVKKFPSRKLVAVPKRLTEDDWSNMEPSERKKYLAYRTRALKRNRAVRNGAITMNVTLGELREMQDMGIFYLPHSMDFRGRAYPIPAVNHQREGYIKACFLFADGVPLGETGGTWLAIHLANCAGFDGLDKKPFEVREQWVADNIAFILRVADDPYGTFDEWSKADSPFCFVAACLDFAGWIRSGYSPDYVSHTPIALDGSNSGIQHYSAIMRCRQEALLVCLTEAAQPHDAYMVVANLANQYAKADIGNHESEKDRYSPHELATLLLEHGGITRSMAKRNTMTYAYSSNVVGFGDQQEEDTMRPINEKVFTGEKKVNPYELPWKNTGELDGGSQMARYIAKLNWRAVNEIVSRATDGMKFFRKVAGALAHESKDIVWYTPVGVPVVHYYPKWETERVATWLYDRTVPADKAATGDKFDPQGRGVLKRVMLNIQRKPSAPVVDKHRQMNAVAPNMIHSLDASHLMLTVLAAHDEGIDHFMMIHDSFATHAGNTSRFFQIIREAFVDMYAGYCPMEALRDYAMSEMADTSRIPELPEKGDWDIREVLRADYAFA